MGGFPTPRVSIEVFGEAALIRALDKLSDKVRKKITPRVMAKAATPILQAARKNLVGHKVTGNLRASLGSRRRVYRSGVTTIVIGPRIRKATARQKGLRGQHGYLVEFGSAQRFRKRIGGLYRRRATGGGDVGALWEQYFGEGRYPTGQMPAIPFMRPAYMSQRRKARGLIFKHLRKEILKEANKNASRSRIT